MIKIEMWDIVRFEECMAWVNEGILHLKELKESEKPTELEYWWG
jgi:hypothetical protein